MIEITLVSSVQGRTRAYTTTRTEDELAYLILVILMKGGRIRESWNQYAWVAELNAPDATQIEAIYFGGRSQ